MVEARDQVFSTLFSPVLFSSLTLFMSSGCHKGALLYASAHVVVPPFVYLPLRRLTMYLSVRFLVLRVL